MLNNKTWLTRNTEVSTNRGWMPIEKVVGLTSTDLKVLTYDEKRRRFLYERIKGFSKFDYNGKVTVLKSLSVYKEFKKTLVVEKNKILTTLEDIEPSEWSQRQYRGPVFNIEVPHNYLFLRHPEEKTKKKSLSAELIKEVESVWSEELGVFLEEETFVNLRLTDYWICLANW